MTEEAGPEKSQPVWKKLQDLRPDTAGHNLEVKVRSMLSQSCLCFGINASCKERDR